MIEARTRDGGVCAMICWRNAEAGLVLSLDSTNRCAVALSPDTLRPRKGDRASYAAVLCWIAGERSAGRSAPAATSPYIRCPTANTHGVNASAAISSMAVQMA